MVNKVPSPPRPDGELLSLGLDLAIRLRDGDDRRDVRRALHSLRVSDLCELAICLAACIDPDTSARELLAWCGGKVPVASRPLPAPRALKPCGTQGAYVRHKTRGEHCPVCLAAMRPIWRERRARRADRKGRAA